MTAAEPSIAVLSRQVAEAKGCWWKRLGFPCPARKRCPEYHHDAGRREGILWPAHRYTNASNLYELEGELQQAGWCLGWLNDHWDCSPPLGVKFEPDRETDRARLILRAWLEMKR